jgi:ribonucleoside-diphosphate reductase alpha chain
MSQKKEYLGIEIDLSRDELNDDYSKRLLKSKYFRGNETSPQEAYARAATGYGSRKKLQQNIYDYASKGWFIFSTPVLSNAPLKGEKPKGLPISCYASYVNDNLESLIDHTAEVRWLAVKGGGVGGHWSDIRAKSQKAPSPIPFLKTLDSDMGAYSQGVTRRGSYAAYLDVSHPDIIEFIKIRIPGGDIHRKCLTKGFHHAVNLTDDFMNAVEKNDDWDLVCPHTKEVRETHKARYIWEKILETRLRTGEPYLNFIDEANRNLPEAQKLLGLSIKGSNLCQEIHLATDDKRSFVCCLSSLNLEKYDEWKDTKIVEDIIEYLDDVLQCFIDNAPDHMSKTVYSAMRERSLGLGRLGFHSYLQSKMISFSDEKARDVVREFSELILSRAQKSSEELAKKRGAYPDYLEASKIKNLSSPARRNAHLLAIAPNANTSIILGTSPSIEPYAANVFNHKTRIGTQTVYNKNLQKLFEDIYSKDNSGGLSKQDWIKKQWKKVMLNDGSVKELDCLNDRQKEVFRTAYEIPQEDIIETSAIRQQFLCQGQSVNLFFPPKPSKEYLNKIHFMAWKLRTKGLYYLRTFVPQKAESIGEKVERVALKDFSTDNFSQETCEACEG